MGDLAISNTFSNNTTAEAPQVNTNFTDIVNYINARNTGASKWDELGVSGDVTVDGSLTVAGVNIGESWYRDGWAPAGETWTYVDAPNSLTARFSVSGDKTGIYSIGDKIKLTQTTVKYFYITAISYSSPNTIITVFGGSSYLLINASITSNYYSKFSSPVGFPSQFAFTVSLIGTSSTLTNNCTFSMEGRKVFLTYDISGVSNYFEFSISLPFSFNSTVLYETVGRSEDNSVVSSVMTSAVNYPADTLVFERQGALWTASGTKSVTGLFIGYL